MFASRILSLNVSSGHVITAVTWRRPSTPKGTNSVTLLEVNGPVRALEEDPKQGARPDQDYPWYEDSNTSSMRPPKFLASPANISYKGWWTFPYYSCTARRWLISYSVPVPPTGRHAYVSSTKYVVYRSNLLNFYSQTKIIKPVERIFKNILSIRIPLVYRLVYKQKCKENEVLKKI